MLDNGEKRVNERDQGMMGGEESWGSTKPQETKEEKVSSRDMKCGQSVMLTEVKKDPI